ncbi:hypothetical protein DNTS_014231 [Danionella cerebrum]|uniref:DUF4515 domain-containing protein n=1 Tax=Danionella cerebrum TaxID=2873325 RepID=A0A553MWD2_9TELE|nr:hypothetical protein DNTS_014231 [Danionella translucida]
MANKKNTSKPQEDVNASSGGESQREILLQMEYDTLRGNLGSLKMKVEQLRKENEFLQNEVSLTQVESEQFISFLSQTQEKRQAAIATRSDRSHEELQDLQRQRKNMQEKHKEQASGVQREIMQMQNQLAKLNNEIADLKDVKTLVALKGDFLKKKITCDKEAQENLRALMVSADEMASQSLVSYMTEVFNENKRVREVLESLLQRVNILLRQQETLLTHRRQLLLEQKHVQKLIAQRFPQSSKPLSPKQRNHTKPPEKHQQLKPVQLQ